MGVSYLPRHWSFKTTFDSVCIPASKIKSTEKFNSIDEKGKMIEQITCWFQGQESCSIRISPYVSGSVIRGNYGFTEFVPVLLFRKGEKIEGVNRRPKEALEGEFKIIKEKIELMIMKIEHKLAQLKNELESPFVPEGVRDIAVRSVTKQLTDMNVMLMDCDVLSGKIR